MSGYKDELKDGREIYIPAWPIDVCLENLTRAGQYLGVENVINIADKNVSAVIVAIMSAKEPKEVASLIKHFVCQARIEGNKIEPGTIEAMFDGNLKVVAELFAHVIHAQYHDFFASGLAKEVSPNRSEKKAS